MAGGSQLRALVQAAPSAFEADGPSSTGTRAARGLDAVDDVRLHGLACAFVLDRSEQLNLPRAAFSKQLLHFGCCRSFSAQCCRAVFSALFSLPFRFETVRAAGRP